MFYFTVFCVCVLVNINITPIYLHSTLGNHTYVWFLSVPVFDNES